jgi:hypothetical protein
MNKQNKQTFMSSQGAMTAGLFLNNAKEKIWTRSWPREHHQSWTPPFPPPEVGLSKRCTNKDLAYSTRDLYLKNWTLRVDLNPIKWTILWPVNKNKSFSISLAFEDQFIACIIYRLKLNSTQNVFMNSMD